MPRRIFRVAKREASWEGEPDVEAIVGVEFQYQGGPDVRPSAYEVEHENPETLRQLALRVAVEHAASYLDPPRGLLLLDVSGAHSGEEVASPGASPYFSFANACHREILLSSEEALRALVRTVSREIVARRLLRVSADEVMAFAARQLEEHDPEWERFRAEGKNAPRWLRSIERHRTRQRPPST